MKEWQAVTVYVVFVVLLFAVSEYLERDRLKRYPRQTVVVLLSSNESEEKLSDEVT